MTAGYSGTPLLAKLGVREGSRLVVLSAPAGFVASLEKLPPRASLRQRGGGEVDVTLLFVTRLSVLRRSFKPAAARMPPKSGMLWIAWPKKASGVLTDLTEDVIRGVGLDAGLVDTKVCAIDGTWSGLRFSRRRT